jgi:dihydroorotate dehydrogenase electron transfer subunit
MNESRPTSELPGLVPCAVQQIAPVVEQVPMARNTYRLRLHCPEIAARIVPGQFFMIRSPGRNDPLLARPFALYDIYEDATDRPAGIDFGYIVIGKLTSLMSTWKAGEPVEIWGPLGNGFPLPPAGRLMMVAGGIGQTPFLAVAREALGLRQYGQPPRQIGQRPARVSLCYGVRSAEYLAGLDDFQMDGLDVQLATDDGTQGHHGYVTELLAQALAGPEPPDAIYCCGPEPMMEAVAKLAIEHGVACWLSLETPMACGFGACFSCVTRVRMDDGSWDYRRACVEGPVFPADRLLLSAADGTPPPQ